MQYELKLKIDGMTCDGCARGVKQALEDAGAKIDIPDWKTGQATVLGALPDGTGSDEGLDSVAKSIAEKIQGKGYRVQISSTRHIETSHNGNTHSPDRKFDFDLAVIGTGGAGMSAAVRAAEAGKRVVVIEKAEIGGTCVNIGCIPSKFLIRAAQKIHDAATPKFRGLKACKLTIDWPEILREKKELVDTLRYEKYENVLNRNEANINLIRGRAQFTGEGMELRVDEVLSIDNVRSVDGVRISAAKVLIATGARMRMPELPGAEKTGILTTTELMDLPGLPASLIVLGGRATALELGQVFSRFGVHVTILQRSSRLLPDHEPEVSTEITRWLQEEGIEVITNVKLLSFETDEKFGSKIIHTEVDGKARKFAAETIVSALGRIPNTDDLNLEAVTVKTEANGAIVVDDEMRTTNPSIFAGGDATTLPQFVYVAAASGGTAADNAMMQTNHDKGSTAQGFSDHERSGDAAATLPRKLDLSVLPAVVFTDPQIATVGLGEEEARNSGRTVKTTMLELSNVPRALTSLDTRGFIKLIADADQNTIIGASIVAPEGGELIQAISMAIRSGAEHGFTIEQFKSMLFPYLTQNEGLKLAALTFDKDVKSLSCCAV